MFARGRALNAVGLGKFHLQRRVLPSPSNFARKYSSPIFGNSRGNIPTGRYNIGAHLAKRRRERERWEKERESWQQLEGGDPYKFDSRPPPPNVVDQTPLYKTPWEQSLEKHRRILAVINGEVQLPPTAASAAASDDESAASGRPGEVATVPDSRDLQSMSFEELQQREKTAQAQPLIPDDVRRALLSTPLNPAPQTEEELAQHRLPDDAYYKYFAQFFPNDPIYEEIPPGLTAKERRALKRPEKVDENFFVIKPVNKPAEPKAPEEKRYFISFSERFYKVQVPEVPTEKLARATNERVVGSKKKLQLVLDMIRKRSCDFAYAQLALRARSTGGAARNVKELLSRAWHNAVVRKGLDPNRLGVYMVLWGRKAPIRGITYHSKGRAGQRNTDVSMVRIVLREMSEEDFVLAYGPHGDQQWEAASFPQRRRFLPMMMAQRRRWLEQRAALHKSMADASSSVDPDLAESWMPQ